MLVVVSDTSPLRALGHLGLLNILQELFGTLVVPPAVEAELHYSPKRGTAVDLEDFPFILVRAPANFAEVQRLRQSLDAGESEALAIAQELQADFILIDEAAGRAVAVELGFHVIGTCGILLRAKQRGLVTDLTPLLDDLIDNLDFFVSSELRKQVLAAAGEKAD